MFEFLKTLFSSEEKKGLGALVDPIDSRDIFVSGFQKPVELSYEYETSIFMIPVQNQKAHGSCVGQAEGTVDACFDYRENANADVSRRYIYAMCKKEDGIPEVQGTYPRIAASILSKKGATTSKMVPDNNDLPYNEYLAVHDTQEILADAKKRRLNYARVDLTLEALKQAIFQNKLVTVTLYVDWKAWKEGRITRPRIIAGAHRVTLYGWKGDNLKFRNSWGESWGFGGNGVFDYDDYKDYLIDALCYTDIPNEILEKAKSQDYIFTKTLRFGDSGYDVKKLQERLSVMPADGFFGSYTRKKVIEFQASNGLMPDGIAGPKTLQKLNQKDVVMTALERAIMKQESGGNINAIGDKTLVDKAYGCLQIRQPCVDDVNRSLGMKMKAEETLGNIELSLFIFREYQKIYNPNGTDEAKARTWNGGPGWKRNPRLTEHYWSAVKRNLQALHK